MKLVGVCACSIGIALTYIAQKKLEAAAKKKGYTIKIETQGTIGTENELTEDEIAHADAVILAVDTEIDGRDRFTGKPIIEVSTVTAIQSPDQIMDKLEKLIRK